MKQETQEAAKQRIKDEWIAWLDAIDREIDKNFTVWYRLFVKR